MKRTVLNKLLLLRMIELAKKVSSYRKTAQLVYIVQEEGRKEGRVTFNYEFTKWHCEPYSSELEKDLQQLHLEGLIIKSSVMELTEKGRALTQKTSDFFEKEKVDSFLKFFAYLHMKETLFETFAYINEKYDIAKYPTDAIISELIGENKADSYGAKRLKEEIDKRFQELEDEDEENLLKAEKILFDETTV